VEITAKDIVGSEVEYSFHSTDFIETDAQSTPLQIDVMQRILEKSGEKWKEQKHKP